MFQAPKNCICNSTKTILVFKKINKNIIIVCVQGWMDPMSRIKRQD